MIAIDCILKHTTNNQQPTTNNHIRNPMESSATTFYPLEINGQKYLICKLPDQPFSTLHDPVTKQIVGQWNNDEARYEITDHIAQFEMINDTNDTHDAHDNPSAHPATDTMTDQQFEQHMRQLIASGAAFTIMD